PLFHRFKGGKGVATAAGVLSGLDLWLGLGSLATWIVIAVFFRYASLASLVAALFAPFFAWYIGLSYDELLVVAGIAALLIWRHQGNIGRLLAGTESRIGANKAS
ncbi:MAG TPA: glycerol-3-phosphate acyltransferase, partial [Burkholderiales bacterium]|nr:glycerol-3-phosphate acyltransferase [Burkholderiales bacterium]